MTGEKTATRLYVDQVLSEGASVGLDHGRAHFLRSVLRLQRGAYLAVFNGRDGEWLARIDGLGKGWCSLEVLDRRRAPVAEPDLWLIFAPIKRARLDFLVEKAAELGCSRLLPVITQHTDVARVNTERLAANVREAAEQCERLSLPEVCPPVSFDALLSSLPEDLNLLVCAESGAAQPLADALSARRGAEGPWAVMCGPEGGFAESELDALRLLPFSTMINLGPRVLRADTAALMALACWQAWLGDRESRPFGRGGDSAGNA